ncbi:filamentous hemagglutinin N-terminal domain-containing protein, partial [Undibacterium sp. CCC2.1]|uniref:beta strand repeat-containing protein n=8 Tax=Pseudomonadati TaxID=3379134 RepID=UPI002B231FC5
MPTAAIGVTPLNATIVNGQVVITQNGKVMTVTNSPNAIIKWNGFNIAVDEVVRFAQQNANSAVLNRVSGVAPSSILGTLTSNGRVFLINPNGIVFGAGARVDTAGLVASTLALSDKDFLNGNYSFQKNGLGENVTNNGTLISNAGSIALLGNTVQNNGIIKADHGSIMLLAGQSVTLVDIYNPALSLVVTAPDNKVINLGSLLGNGLKAALIAHDIQVSGLINANTAALNEHGEVVIKASGTAYVDGTITATNAAALASINLPDPSTQKRWQNAQQDANYGKGGQVQILGETLTLTSTAQLNTSGRLGGGSIFLGGGYQGKNADLPNALTTTVAPGATLHADALEYGHGGEIIVWSDKQTHAGGTLTARGGLLGGDGGLVETSGKQSLNVADISVDASARNHSASNGTWLMDPTNITIVSGAASGGGFNVSSVKDGDINAALNGGTNVVIDTHINNTTGNVGNVLFSGTADAGGAAIINKTLGGNTNLTVNADQNITLDAGARILASGIGTLNVALNTRANSSLITDLGGLSINGVAGVQTIQTNGGNVNFNGGVGGTLGISSMYMNNGQISTQGGDFNLNASSSKSTVDVGNSILSINSSNIAVAAGGVTINGNFDANTASAGQYSDMFLSASTIKATGSKPINITLSHDNNATFTNYGMYINNASTIQHDGSGDITLINSHQRLGVAGDGGGPVNNTAIYVRNSSHILQNGSGNITIDAAAGDVYRNAAPFRMIDLTDSIVAVNGDVNIHMPVNNIYDITTGTYKNTGLDVGLYGTIGGNNVSLTTNNDKLKSSELVLNQLTINAHNNLTLEGSGIIQNTGVNNPALNHFNVGGTVIFTPVGVVVDVGGAAAKANDTSGISDGFLTALGGANIFAIDLSQASGVNFNPGNTVNFTKGISISSTSATVPFNVTGTLSGQTVSIATSGPVSVSGTVHSVAGTSITANSLTETASGSISSSAGNVLIAGTTVTDVAGAANSAGN